MHGSIHNVEQAPMGSMEDIKKQQEQIMMPGIFQHMGKYGGVGSIEPPSFEEDDDEDEDFA